MSFERPTLQTIYNRIKADMESRLKTDRKILRYSFLGIMAYVFAGAVYLCYGYLVFLADQLFPDTAIKEFLDRLGIERSLPRKSATYATGIVLFSGTNGTVIVEGTKLQSADGLEFSTIDEVAISGSSISADIQCDTAGIAGNVTDTTLQLITPIIGVDTEATVTTALNGGVDTETDDQYRYRIEQRYQNPPSCGTVADYIRWALEVPGIGRAWCLKASEYLGPGTVGVVIATSDLNTVAPAVKSDVVTYIASVKPEVAAVDVSDIIRQNTDYFVSINPNTQEYRDAATAELEALHQSEAAPNGTILLTHIYDALKRSGVLDYDITNIRLAGVDIGEQNVVTSGFRVAVFNSAAFADL